MAGERGTSTLRSLCLAGSRFRGPGPVMSVTQTLWPLPKSLWAGGPSQPLISLGSWNEYSTSIWAQMSQLSCFILQLHLLISRNMSSHYEIVKETKPKCPFLTLTSKQGGRRTVNVRQNPHLYIVGTVGKVVVDDGESLPGYGDDRRGAPWEM